MLVKSPCHFFKAIGKTYDMNKKIIRLTLILIVLICTGFENEIVNPLQTYTFERMETDLIKLNKRYNNDLVTVVIGRSHFGKPIYATKLGNGRQSIIVLGGHHGREWLTSTLTMKMLEQYAEGYKKKAIMEGYSTSILDDVSIWFIPMVNPDGITIQQTGVNHLPKKLQKQIIQMNNGCKDFSRWKANGIGIDLNRQYPAGWTDIKGSVSKPSYQLYKGKFPLEAAEVKSVVKFTRKIKPLAALSYHSSGRVLYWEFQEKGSELNRNRKIAKKISKMTGYKLDTPEENAVGGGYTDWFSQEFKLPAFTPEISYYVKDNSPPTSVFQEEWMRNRAVGLFLAKEVKRLFVDEKRE